MWPRVLGLSPKTTLPPLPSGQHVAIDQAVLSGGFAAHLWPSAAVLCRWQLRTAERLIRGKDVLELGAGTGAVGIFAAALGARRVTLTDAGSLHMVRRNVEANRELWRAAATEVHVAPLRWGDESQPGADLLLGSDVTYDESCAGALCDSLARALAAREGCRAVLSHEHRMHGSDDFALQAICDAAAARGLAVACRGSEPLRPGMSRANAVWGSVLEVVQGNGGPQCRGCGLLLATGSGARCEWCRKRSTG